MLLDSNENVRILKNIRTHGDRTNQWAEVELNVISKRKIGNGTNKDDEMITHSKMVTNKMLR